MPHSGTGTPDSADPGIARPLARPAAGGPGRRMLMPGLPAQPALSRTIAAENHRDGDQSDGSDKPDQDRGYLQTATVVRRFPAAPARARRYGGWRSGDRIFS